jgi:hypothetical protein
LHTTTLAGCVAGVTPSDDVWSTCTVLYVSSSVDGYIGLEELAIPPNVQMLAMETGQAIMVIRGARVFEI